MGSFYAGIQFGSGGGGGSYDTLKDVPIVNVGTAETTTILSGLEVGHYNLKGNYKAAIGEDEVDNNSSLDVLVLYDSTKSQRVVQFLAAEDGEIYLHMYRYNETGDLVDQDKISLTAPSHASWGSI